MKFFLKNALWNWILLNFVEFWFVTTVAIKSKFQAQFFRLFRFSPFIFKLRSDVKDFWRKNLLNSSSRAEIYFPTWHTRPAELCVKSTEIWPCVVKQSWWSQRGPYSYSTVTFYECENSLQEKAVAGQLIKSYSSSSSTWIPRYEFDIISD